MNNNIGIAGRQLQRHIGIIIYMLLICTNANSQRRIVIINMETGVPVRGVIVQYGATACDTTIWDGSLLIDTLADDCRSREITLRRSGYMTRTMTFEELTDTIDLLPSFNALTEVIVYGQNKKGMIYFSLPNILRPSLPSPSEPALRKDLDISGAIDKLFSYKRRKRLEETKKRMDEY